MPARKVHLGAACLEARAGQQNFANIFTVFYYGQLLNRPLVIDFEDKYPNIRWTQCIYNICPVSQ